MPNNPEYDVAIVGASIAGCTAAILFARNGARVALIERDPDPAAYKKICTHLIQPSATPTVERLGLADAIEAAGGVRKEIEACASRTANLLGMQVKNSVNFFKDLLHLTAIERFLFDHLLPSDREAPYRAKVLHVSPSPDFKPAFNHWTRCAAVPWVKESGTA